MYQIFKESMNARSKATGILGALFVCLLVHLCWGLAAFGALAAATGPATARYEIVTAVNSFHGRTVACIAATGQDKIKAGFGPMVPGYSHVPFNDLQAVREAIGPQVCRPSSILGLLCPGHWFES